MKPAIHSIALAVAVGLCWLCCHPIHWPHGIFRHQRGAWQVELTWEPCGCRCTLPEIGIDCRRRGRTWRAYPSTGWTSTTPVNARDRTGKGPWFNAKGVLIATDVDNLHSANHLTKATALNEKGEMVKGRGDTPTCTTF